MDWEKTENINTTTLERKEPKKLFSRIFPALKGHTANASLCGTSLSSRNSGESKKTIQNYPNDLEKLQHFQDIECFSILWTSQRFSRGNFLESLKTDLPYRRNRVVFFENCRISVRSKQYEAPNCIPLMYCILLEKICSGSRFSRNFPVDFCGQQWRNRSQNKGNTTSCESVYMQ